MVHPNLVNHQYPGIVVRFIVQHWKANIHTNKNAKFDFIMANLVKILYISNKGHKKSEKR